MGTRWRRTEHSRRAVFKSSGSKGLNLAILLNTGTSTRRPKQYQEEKVMTDQKTTVVLAHGASAESAGWNEVIGKEPTR